MKGKVKNQHYVPQFYLRNFSNNKNGKTLSIYDVNTGFYFDQAGIKTQVSEKYFYGEDGKIEDALSKVESIVSPTIKKIIETKIIPNKSTLGYKKLLYFAVLNDLRNKARINEIIAAMSDLQSLQIGIFGDDKNQLPEITHEKVVHMNLGMVNEVSNHCNDLSCKIIKNNTNIPFITSDLPIVHYNQYLNQIKHPRRNSAIASIGFQMFLPISNDLILLFYDGNVYKVGNKKDNHLTINNTSDVDQLNILQIINCQSTVFFNNKIKKPYIDKLNAIATKYKVNKKPKTNIYNNVKDLGNQTNNNTIIHSESYFLDMHLTIAGIKINSKYKALNLDKTKFPCRDKFRNM